MTTRNELADLEKKALLTNRAYDVAKNFVVLYIPATVTLYLGLAVIFGLPYIDEITKATPIVLVFLGSVLKISDRSYENSGQKYDGAIVADPENEDGLYPLKINLTASELQNKDSVQLKVVGTPAG